MNYTPIFDNAWYTFPLLAKEGLRVVVMIMYKTPLIFFKNYALVAETVRLEFWGASFVKSSKKFQKD